MITKKKHAKLQNRFETILRGTGRDGIEELLTYLHETDFFRAPASTEYYGAYPGGLLEHSLRVYDLCQEKLSSPNTTWAKIAQNPTITPDTVAIVALLHNLDKIGVYQQAFRNVKVYDPERVSKAPQNTVKYDDNGDYIWETVKIYEYNDPTPLGKSEKSVITAMKYIRLTDEEIYGIRWSGGFGCSAGTHDTSRAFVSCPLALAMYESDLEAMYLFENE